MSVDKIHIRHCMLYEFKKGNNATRACKNICKVYGKRAVNERTCQRWFTRFRTGDISLQDEPRPGRSSDIKNDDLLAVIQSDNHQSVGQIAEKLGVHRTTVYRKMHSIELKKARDMECESPPKKQFSPVPTPSGSLLSGNLTGTPRKIKDSIADFYNSVQKWNSYTIGGVSILKELVNVKLHIINAKEEKTDDESLTNNSTHLQELCDELHALIVKMENEVPKMEKTANELKGIKNLVKLQSSVGPCTGDAKKIQSPIFLTWPVEKFYDTVLELLGIYEKELEIKKNVAQEVARMKDENSLNFLVAAWTYESYVGEQSQLLLNSMLSEAGLQ